MASIPARVSTASGGERGALARRADEVYASLDAEGRAATRQLFLRLVTLGEGMEDTLRRVLRAELVALAGRDDRPDEADGHGLASKSSDKEVEPSLAASPV